MEGKLLYIYLFTPNCFKPNLRILTNRFKFFTYLRLIANPDIRGENCIGLFLSQSLVALLEPVHFFLRKVRVHQWRGALFPRHVV